MIKKLKLTATRTDEYEIFIDDKIYDKAALEEYSKVFNKVETIEELSKDLAFKILRNGTGNFLEGFGVVKTLYSNGMVMSQLYQGRIVKEQDYAQGILVKIIAEDADHEFEVQEVM